jgi:hypothetical protein
MKPAIHSISYRDPIAIRQSNLAGVLYDLGERSEACDLLSAALVAWFSE